MREVMTLAFAALLLAACASDGNKDGSDDDSSGDGGGENLPGDGSGGSADDGSGGSADDGSGGSADEPRGALDCTDEEIWCGGSCLGPGESAGPCSRIYESENVILNAPLAGSETKIFLGNPELMVMNLDGTDVMQLSDKRPTDMAAAGDTLYFISYDNGSLSGGSLYSIPIAGGTEVELTSDIFDPSQLRVIGNRLYFREQVPDTFGDHEIVSFDLTGGDKQVHTPPTVRSYYTVSDTHLYYSSRVEPVDGGSDVWTVARAPLTGSAADAEDIADGEHDGFAWGNDKLYYLRGGFFEWDPSTAEETMLLDNSMMGPPAETSYVLDGHYIGYENQGGIIINLTTLQMSDMETDGWFYNFISDGRLFYVDDNSVVAIDVP